MKEAIKKYLDETMVFVEGGDFMMGSEKSIHKVELSSFEINKYPVTQELYEWVMEKNPSYFKGKERPVEQVDWYDAIEFCNALSELMGIEKSYYSIDKEKQDLNNKRESDPKKWLVEINEGSKGYRLLTEAEWEYAVRGGQKGKNDKFEYAGDKDLNKVGWYDKNSHEESKEVGLKAPNQLGLYDMSGNVREWCWDWYGGYKEETEKNPRGAESGKWRVVRGGSWSSYAYGSRVALRDLIDPVDRIYFIGFRISRAV
ncbi:MAG: formylglycine-generating enzyme family protein [Flammeovirgaceae bacterium]|nr:formylglycine-generating enzyme family protein [Flammeovirgaceae bacterium]